MVFIHLNYIIINLFLSYHILVIIFIFLQSLKHFIFIDRVIDFIHKKDYYDHFVI
jgi:hypothetical protein